VLLSGNHAEIDRWRHRERLRRTEARRPDLIDHAALTDEERRELEMMRPEADGRREPWAVSRKS
jgi:tRNA (guanine37-N1)-methyltransferase